jgi:hypothetical protein
LKHANGFAGPFERIQIEIAILGAFHFLISNDVQPSSRGEPVPT